MIKVSSEFYNAMKSKTDFKQYAEITLKDGTVLKLDKHNFTLDNNSISDTANNNTIPLGVAIARNIQIELMNDFDQFSTYDFFGAKIRLYLTLELETTEEKVEFGTFTVISPTTRGTTIIITAVDDMYNLDKPYTTNLIYPQKLIEIYKDICTQCSILPDVSSLNFLNSDVVIKEKPGDDNTFRQILGNIAMIACGNARINRFGKMEILTYDFEFLASQIDGGHFKPWDQLSDTDGGHFEPWNTGVVLDGGGFTQKDMTYHTLTQFKNLDIDTDDVMITGIKSKYTDEEDKEHDILIGEEGYVLSVENPLFGTQKEQVTYFLQLLDSKLTGARMRRFTGDHTAYPLVEFMDNIVIADRKGNIYTSVITDVNFNFFGLTTIKNSADNHLHNRCEYVGQGAKIIASTKKLVEKEKTQRELAVQNLAQQLATSSGLYMTQDVQPDGSIIYYMHDKPKLSESMIVWKLTAQAIGISIDGGKTYPYGLNATGEAILSLVYAIGLDADYITSGRISDRANKNYWDLKDGNFQITSGALNVTGKRIFEAKNYNKSDRDRLGGILSGTIQPTQDDFNKYDIDLDGKFDGQDFKIVNKLVNNNISQHITDTSAAIDATGNSSYIIKAGDLQVGVNAVSMSTLNTDNVIYRGKAAYFTTPHLTYNSEGLQSIAMISSGGVMTLTQKVKFTADISGKWGYIYNTYIDLGEWAESFGDTPMITSVVPSDNAGWFFESVSGGTSATNIGTIYIMRPVSGTITGYAIVTAVGQAAR